MGDFIKVPVPDKKCLSVDVDGHRYETKGKDYVVIDREDTARRLRKIEDSMIATQWAFGKSRYDIDYCVQCGFKEFSYKHFDENGEYEPRGKCPKCGLITLWGYEEGN